MVNSPLRATLVSRLRGKFVLFLADAQEREKERIAARSGIASACEVYGVDSGV